MARMYSSTGNDPSKEKWYKMVLIGETGSGKTRLIQLLLNYAKQSGKEFDPMKINSFVEVEHSKEQTAKSWDSDTTKSKKYKADFGDFKLDIIDTPGFADTRGEEQKKKNVANIINKVKEEHYVNCICLVINGTQGRLTSVMREVISEITSILPPDVIRNIIVVFTKTRDEYSLDFDIDVLKEEFDLTIPEGYIFMLDNPYARWEKAKANPTSKSIARMKADFTTTFETLREMFAVIKRLKLAFTLKFGEFHEVVDDIEVCLAELRSNCDNRNSVKRKIDGLQLYEVDALTTTYEKIELVYTSTRNVVCNICHNTCHEQCDCRFTFLSTRMCSCFRFSKCKKCDHSHEEHTRNRYYFKKVEVAIPGVESLLAAVKEKKSVIEAAKEVISTFDQCIATAAEKLVKKLKKFQGLGSSFFFSKNALSHIDHLKKEITKMEGFEDKKRIVDTLDATLEVLHDPLTTTNDDVKFRWACGMLGADPDHVTAEDISGLFREQSRRSHPDATGDDSSSRIFKYMNHAKDFLKKKLSNRR